MKALILIEDGFEDIEFFYLWYRLQEEGIPVTVVSTNTHTLTGLQGSKVEPDQPVSGLSVADYDLLLIPGGRSPERLRVREEAVDLVRTFMQEGQMVGAVSHGPQVLISSGALDGCLVTCSPGIRDDVRCSGATWRDESVVVDNSLITARGRADLPDFTRQLLQMITTRVRR